MSLTWARSRFDVTLPADRTAVFGVSASAELALAMGLRHPDIYGAVFCASPGAGYRPPALMPNPLPRAYLVAGTQEPFFLANAIRCADALHDAGADDPGSVRPALRARSGSGIARTSTSAEQPDR